MKYSIQKIASILGIKNQHLLEGEITQLLTDSRKLNYPQETLFFAIETRQNDAHKFIADLYGSGVRNFVVTKILPSGNLSPMPIFSKLATHSTPCRGGRISP